MITATFAVPATYIVTQSDPEHCDRLERRRPTPCRHNTAAAETSIDRQVDLRGHQGVAAVGGAGTAVDYTITVSNAGASDAINAPSSTIRRRRG